MSASFSGKEKIIMAYMCIFREDEGGSKYGEMLTGNLNKGQREFFVMFLGFFFKFENFQNTSFLMLKET